MLDHDRRIGTTGLDEDASLIPDLSNGLIDRSIYTIRKFTAWSCAGSSPAPGTSCATKPRFQTRATTSSTTSARTRSSPCGDDDGQVRVLLNTCRHRGNALCRAELGNTRTFVCSYHGWTYGLDGKLIGIPGKTDFYRDDVDQAKLGLVPAAKVDQYKGFCFATLDPAAPSLFDYLGEVGRIGIESMLDHGDVVALDGVQKNVIDCNWKIAVDNLFDWYHVKVSHNSASRVGFLNQRHDDADDPDGDAG